MIKPNIEPLGLLTRRTFYLGPLLLAIVSGTLSSTAGVYALSGQAMKALIQFARLCLPSSNTSGL